MSLYPSLEDMKVDQLQQAQHRYEAAVSQQQHSIQYPPQGVAVATGPSLYPSLDEYMGLSITELQQTMQLVPAAPMHVAQYQPSGALVAPVTGSDVGLRRAEVKQGIREVVLCKDAEGKVGLRLRAVNRGVFVALVHKDSPAALAGLRFGDQILQVNNETVAGYDTDKIMNLFKKIGGERITLAVRDRPFERTITMQKDSTGHIGFVFKDGEIKSLVKDSSAAKNGLLTEHYLIEVNGQNVVGMKDKDVMQIIDVGGRTITVTIIPEVIYKQIVKCMGSSLITKLMDHSIPDM